jgi:hypothetical protein
MGLLDIQFDPDPVKNAQFKRGLLDFGLNMLAQGNKSTGAAIGNAGLMTQQARMQRDQQAQHDERAKTQQQLLQGQVEQMQRLQQMQKLPQQFMRADKPATMDDRDVGQPGEAPLQRKFDADGYTNALMGLDPMQGLAMQAATRKQEPTPVAYGPDQTVGTWRGGDFIPAFKTPPKPEANKPPSSVQEYEYAKGQGYKGTFEQFQIAQRRAGASSVSVNTGQKGFDNTLKLRSDFRSEPIYKAHQEVEGAYRQIKQGLAMQSPAGDLAGATKVMKLLDPGSVVRESELVMAMQASGALDRLLNYSDRVLKGTKLTPSQRTDFQALADALYRESVKQYSAKRSEYAGIVGRNQLNKDDVLGPEPTTPATEVDFRSLK